MAAAARPPPRSSRQTSPRSSELEFDERKESFRRPNAEPSLPQIFPARSREEIEEEEAYLNPDEAEQLREEAERMKGLGNKHMASQEYTRAYNAYSAALQLSPVGPSSHVYLSNRAAALLSLRRYSAAAVDARRAVALAPSFGKAHARLGQALYFLRDYPAAVRAYEDAVRYEPDNAVTWTYLSKAQAKMAKEEERRKRRERGEEISVAVESVSETVTNSVATDPNRSAAVVSGMRVDIGLDPGKSSATVGRPDPPGAPPLEVRTGVMGPGGAQAKPAPVITEDIPHEEEALSPESEAYPRDLQGDFEADQGADGSDHRQSADFEQALSLRSRADSLLSRKQYRAAIEEYSAALFLIPDDPELSLSLHIGRAHALNGLKRHSSAANDGRMAVGLDPDSAEAYSVLAKSLFYDGDYSGAVDAFEKGAELYSSNNGSMGVEGGGGPSAFDHAYLEKAREFLAAEESYNEAEDAAEGGGAPGSASITSYSTSGASRRRKNGSVVPKLKPPRFVSREKLIQSQPSLRPMPKAWPQQNSHSPKSFRVGPERVVEFLSESMGIKLNRGPDGFVRVITVAPAAPGTPILRRGDVLVGDVVREAHGVDLRRPITNVMWGDTVALIKLAPRPVSLVLAQELTPPPTVVAEEMAKNAAGVSGVSVRPSPANGEEPVIESIAKADDGSVADDGSGGIRDSLPSSGDSISADSNKREEDKCKDIDEESVDGKGSLDGGLEPQEEADATVPGSYGSETPGMKAEVGASTCTATDKDAKQDSSVNKIEISAKDVPPQTLAEAPLPKVIRQSSRLDKEVEALGGEILFEAATPKPTLADEVVGSPPRSTHGWTNEKWMSASASRILRHSGHVTRVNKGRFFWSGEVFAPRVLALFRNPDLIVVLREPQDAEEVRKLLSSSTGAKASNYGLDVAASDIQLQHSFLVAESVVDPKTCKLRLSLLTTATSIAGSDQSRGRGAMAKPVDPRRRTCFELVTPSETIVLSAVVPGDEEASEGEEGISYGGSTAYYETSAWEVAISKALFDVHRPIHEALAAEGAETDQAWKHQVVLGTLHSHVLSGDVETLRRALSIVLAKSPPNHSEMGLSEKDGLRILNGKDEFGLTPLHYACAGRLSFMVSELVASGADCSTPTLRNGKTACHLAAEFLDHKSLSIILSASTPVRPNPNALDKKGRTPMYVAAVEGKAVGGGRDHVALGLCLSALTAWGGKTLFAGSENDPQLPHPVYCAASKWRSAELGVILSQDSSYLYPIQHPATACKEESGISLGALFQYPIHAALISLLKKIRVVKDNIASHSFGRTETTPPLVDTMRVLLDHGFEPNERIEGILGKVAHASEMNGLVGFTPLQILAAVALEANKISLGSSKAVSSPALADIFESIAETAELLVRKGARLNVEPPPFSRLRRDQEAGRSSSCLLPGVERSALKLDEKNIIKLFGGESKMRSALDYWLGRKTAKWTPQIVIDEDISKGTIPDSNSPGGSDSFSCYLCWSKFGTLMNRKHACRVSRRYVCEECSRSRITKGGKEFRVTDGQYQVALSMAQKGTKDELQRKKNQRNDRKQHIMAQAQAHRNRASGERLVQSSREKQEDSARDELFGNAATAVANSVKNFFFEEVEVLDEESTEDQLQGIAATLSQTKDAFNERGERLNSLSEKTAALKDASRDFAKMAQELEKQQKGGLFW